MNNMDNFLYQIRKQGIDVLSIGSDLKIKGKIKHITSDLLAYIKENKQAILDHLQSACIQYYPISSLQKRMCLSYYSSAKKFAHNLYSFVSLQDNVNCERLRNSFQQLINDHEILRTGYQQFNDDIVQVIFAEKFLDYDFHELHSMKEIEQWGLEQARIPFCLEEGRVFRVRIAESKETGESILLVAIHHVASDFDSLQLIYQLVNEHYFAQNREMQSIYQFKTLTLEERNSLDTPRFLQSLSYWGSQYIKGAEQTTFMNSITDHDAGVFVGKSNTYLDELGIHLSKEIEFITKQLSVSSHTLLLAIFEIIVGFYAKRSLFNVGLPISKRKNEQAKMLGMLVDTYWVRVELFVDVCFIDFLNQVKQDTLNILSYTACGFFDILENVNIRPGKHFPIFQVMFNWIKSRVDSKNPLVKQYYGSKNMGFDAVPYELMLNVSNENQHVKLLWVYHLDVFNASEIKKMANDYKKLIIFICKDPKISISALQQILRSQ